MDDEKVVILGGRGMLGSDLAELCRKKRETVVLDLPEFDITDYGQLEEAVKRASIVINCAAYTNVDRAESETEAAYRINGEAVGELGSLAKRYGVWVLHISTDFVFDGSGDRPYAESDVPRPINAYGRSKLAGEQLLIKSGCRSCIVRLEWTYGLRGNNFVKKLLERARTSGSLKVVDDQVGSPTATTEAARTIGKLLDKRPEGLFHFASDGYISRYDMAKFIFDRISMDVEVYPCKTSDYASPATRPLNSRFDCSRIRELLGEPIAGWEEPLEAFLEQL